MKPPYLPLQWWARGGKKVDDIIDITADAAIGVGIAAGLTAVSVIVGPEVLPVAIKIIEQSNPSYVRLFL